MSSSWVEISKNAIKSNIHSFKSILQPGVKFAAIVKSNAYGHGILEVSKIAISSGADLLGVNSLDEAIFLRQNLPDTKILIMGEIPDLKEKTKFVSDPNFSIVVSRLDEIQILNSLPSPPKIHLKTDTGMGRLGFHGKKLTDLICEIKEENIELHGIMTHFASTEDFTEHSYSKMQLSLFKEYIEFAKKIGFENLTKHSASSASTILFRDAHFDMVRVGISLYGLWPSRETKLSHSLVGKNEFRLTPALSWKTKIVHIQDLEIGSYIGYGSTYKTNYPTKVAVLPVGYFEGIDRRLSNQGNILIKGRRARILGRVCMNMCMIDVTHIPEVTIGDTVVLIGKSGDESISADDISSMIGTINYEVVTNIHASIPRLIVD
ncbi:MAG: alanine racemase [Leptospiraceae bacterium]|nr:alanine racemase [Leptospiraceae bacterium]MCK6382159.1 alanine racemase [Leptospiraceae bacterium]NUM41497.1 alanine racemase [Leptospiraceae bacterium]